MSKGRQRNHWTNHAKPFSYKNYVFQPVFVSTKRTGIGKQKGGKITLGKFIKELRLLLKDKSAHVVTMMFDFYGLHHSFKEDCESDQDPTEGKLVERANDDRFISYFQIHEFESLLFSDVEQIQVHLSSNSKIQSLKGIPPESINHDNPPSLRLQNAYPKNSKLIDGIHIAESIGIDKMRQECPHFD